MRKGRRLERGEACESALAVMVEGRALAGGTVIVRRLIYARTAITLLLGRIPTAVPVPLARMRHLFTDVHFP